MTMTTRVGTEGLGIAVGREEEADPGGDAVTPTRDPVDGDPRDAGRPRAERRRPRLLVEITLLSIAYALYATVRDRQGEDARPAAFGRALVNAGRVVGLEQRLGWYHELDLQRWLLADHLLIKVLDVVYATAHITVTAAVLVWLFVRQPGRYRPARTALLLGTGAALVAFWAFPTAPPRLLVSSGFTDTLARVGGLWSFRTPAIEHIVDPFAAMPSLHLAWATWCTLALLPSCSRRWTKGVVLAYPVLVGVIVVATGNHYFLDVVAGSAVALAAWWAAGWLGRAARPARKEMALAVVTSGASQDHLGDLAVDPRLPVRGMAGSTRFSRSSRS